MKIRLELNIPGDGRVFLNFWDSMHGNDVCCEVVNGRLVLDDDNDKQDGKRISLSEFIRRVEKEVAKYAFDQDD